MEDCGVLSPLSLWSLVPAVATVDMERAEMCRGSADTASSITKAVAPSLDEHAEPRPCRLQSADGSVLDDIADTDADNCSMELLEPTTTPEHQQLASVNVTDLAVATLHNCSTEMLSCATRRHSLEEERLQCLLKTVPHVLIPVVCVAMISVKLS